MAASEACLQRFVHFLARSGLRNTRRREHYLEAMAIVRRHYGRVPLKWWLAWPYAVWWRSRAKALSCTSR